MAKLFLDIETLPAAEDTKPMLREVWQRREARKGKEVDDETFDEFWLGTSFSGDWGRILCVGYALDEGSVEIIHGEEPEILRRFWRVVEPDTLFIGHSLFDFDLPFLLKRSIIHRVKPGRTISFARYRSDQIYDVMHEWNRWAPREKTSLEFMAVILGIPSPKTEIHGSEIFQLFAQGELDRIFEYCRGDVEVVRSIYRRLTFT